MIAAEVARAVSAASSRETAAHVDPSNNSKLIT
jgi:hypothetical protein